MKHICDMHTHTVFGDGKSTPEQMVLSAIQKGCKTLGISEHAYAEFDGAAEWCMSAEGQSEYAAEVLRLKQKYSADINIMLGAELDYYCPPLTIPCEYIIGSVHMLKTGDRFVAVDLSVDELKDAVSLYFDGEPLKLVREYYELVADVADKTRCNIIGHFDLITKFNEKYPMFDTSASKYKNIALQSLDALLEKHLPFEINTGAVSRGWRTDAYPEEFILRRIAERGGAVVIDSDAHSAQNIFFDFDRAYEYARFCGVKNFVTY